MKRFLSIIILIEFFISATAQLKSPESFLGYKIGEHFTPHAQLVNYFRHAAEAAPEMMSITDYGKTNEGRPLLLAYISTAENIRNLENIRKNNLRLTNMALDRMAPVLETPVIVWLSYNVHGNEPSSSEASMLTLYSLHDASNTNAKAW